MIVRKHWTLEGIREIYHMPLLELISDSAELHKTFHKPGEIQASTLLSIKTGGCTEDCSYCPQSFKYHTDVKASKMLSVQDVIKAATEAKNGGCSRFCMGAAWREIRDNRDFATILEMIRAVATLDLEVCCSMGMLNQEQALALKNAGLTIYNHNIDTSEDYYAEIISTRSYKDRLATLKNLQEAGIDICSGGIIGMRESEEDRINMIHTLSSLPKPPSSVPVNMLIPIQGTPMEDYTQVSVWELIRVIATIRMVMPASQIRLAAGRSQLSMEAQALCFIAGANAVFLGEKLLTAPNNELDKDKEMIKLLGIHLK